MRRVYVQYIQKVNVRFHSGLPGRQGGAPSAHRAGGILTGGSQQWQASSFQCVTNGKPVYAVPAVRTASLMLAVSLQGPNKAQQQKRLQSTVLGTFSAEVSRETISGYKPCRPSLESLACRQEGDSVGLMPKMTIYAPILGCSGPRSSGAPLVQGLPI